MHGRKRLSRRDGLQGRPESVELGRVALEESPAVCTWPAKALNSVSKHNRRYSSKGLILQGRAVDGQLAGFEQGRSSIFGCFQVFKMKCDWCRYLREILRQRNRRRRCESRFLEVEEVHLLRDTERFERLAEVLASKIDFVEVVQCSRVRWDSGQSCTTEEDVGPDCSPAHARGSEAFGRLALVSRNQYIGLLFRFVGSYCSVEQCAGSSGVSEMMPWTPAT
jgi:hypothetical protein